MSYWDTLESMGENVIRRGEYVRTPETIAKLAESCRRAWETRRKHMPAKFGRPKGAMRVKVERTMPIADAYSPVARPMDPKPNAEKRA